MSGRMASDEKNGRVRIAKESKNIIMLDAAGMMVDMYKPDAPGSSIVQLLETILESSLAQLHLDLVNFGALYSLESTSDCVYW
jgi:hypothetical protein